MSKIDSSIQLNINEKLYTEWIKEDSSSHIPFTEVEINLKKDGGSALKKSTID